ncbi:MAG TPA: general secretion pathway protein GspB [Methylomirabilota bacterium]|nr:general secretion pathway protein GspB [Methylomirabilota bacterium]
MSYILEALKRAEEQRGATPRAVPTPRALPDGPSRARWWWIGGGVLGAAVVVGAVVSWTTTTTAPPAAVPSVAGSPSPVASSPPRLEPAPRVELPPPRLEPAPRVEPPTPPRVEPAPRVAPSLLAEPAPRASRRSAPPARGAATEAVSAPAPRPAPLPAAETARAAPPQAPAPEPAPPAPATGDIKALTAKLSLQVLGWAPDAKDRFVFLNGRKYREGQTVEDKLLVERITEDSVVLSFQGQRVTLKSP